MSIRRANGLPKFDAFMVYTTKVGGHMTVRWASREQYEEAKRTGRLNVAEGWSEPEWVTLMMVAWAPLGELRDFVLEAV